MQRLPGSFRVYVGLVSTGYLNTEVIDQTIRDGLLYCGAVRRLEPLKPGARLLVKADVALADEKIARHTYTHPEIMRSALAQTFSIAPQLKVTVTSETTKGYPGFRALQKA